MGSRSDWLTEFAKPVADQLAIRAGSLKHVLSAGVMALDGCTASQREYYMARATGVEVDAEDEDGRIARIVIRLFRDGHPALDPEDRAFLEAVRQLLAADTAESAVPEAAKPSASRHRRTKAS